MNDMSRVIVPKSDQINSDDLIGGPRTITITGVEIRAATEQPVSIHFDGDEGKPWRPCKSMSRVLVQAWGPDASKYTGRSLTLYRDPKVKWGGLEVGGIRVSHMSDIDGKMQMALTETRGKRTPFVVMPLANAPAAKPDKAADGAKALIARIEAGEDITADPQVVKQREYLAKNRPELAAQVDEAMARLSAPADPDDPFGLPPVDHREGRDDTDMGEGFNDDPPASEDPRAARLAATREQIATATNERGLKAVDAEWQKHSAAYDDAEVAEINGLIAARRKELGA